MVLLVNYRVAITHQISILCGLLVSYNIFFYLSLIEYTIRFICASNSSARVDFIIANT